MAGDQETVQLPWRVFMFFTGVSIAGWFLANIAGLKFFWTDQIKALLAQPGIGLFTAYALAGKEEVEEDDFEFVEHWKKF